MPVVVVAFLLLLLMACGHLPPSEGMDASTSPPSTDSSTQVDGSADAQTDSGWQPCKATGSSACQCKEGESCEIDCSAQQSVSCLAGSSCTVKGSQCTVACVGAGTTCQVGDCIQCICNESDGGTCTK